MLILLHPPVSQEEEEIVDNEILTLNIFDKWYDSVNS
jgi:hypothetical protein